MQRLVGVHVEFGLSTLIGDSDDLTLQVAVAHEEDSTVHLNCNVRTTVIIKGKESFVRKKAYINHST